MPQGTDMTYEPIPEFVYKSIYTKLDNPDLLERNNIYLYQGFNPVTNRNQIIAYANAGKYDAVIVIFEDFDGRYQEVFSLKLKYIWSVQFKSSTIIITCMDESGPGTMTFNYYLLRNSTSGYYLAWRGLANHMVNDYYPQINYEVTAGVNNLISGEFVHNILQILYKDNDPTNTVSVEKASDIYKLDENKKQYVFVKRL